MSPKQPQTDDLREMNFIGAVILEEDVIPRVSQRNHPDNHDGKDQHKASTTSTTTTIQMLSTLFVSVRTTVVLVSIKLMSFGTARRPTRCRGRDSSRPQRSAGRSLCRGRPRGDRTSPACRPAVGRRPFSIGKPSPGDLDGALAVHRHQNTNVTSAP